MSAFLTKAEALRDSIAALPELAGTDVLVDHQKDMVSEFKRAMAKTKGSSVVIFFSGYDTHEEDVAESEVISNYVVTVWTKPVLRQGETPADDMVSAIHKALHGKADPDNCRNRIAVTGGKVIPNTQFLIHELRLKFKHHL